MLKIKLFAGLRSPMPRTLESKKRLITSSFGKHAIIIMDGFLQGVDDWLKSIDPEVQQIIVQWDRIVEILLNMDQTMIIATGLIGFFPVILLLAYDLYKRYHLPEHEVAFLQELYETTGGKSWNRKDGWDGYLNGSWFYDPHNMYGISIRSGHVAKIDLYRNNLAGACIPNFILPY
jgi:hypothetical protein